MRCLCLRINYVAGNKKLLVPQWVGACELLLDELKMPPLMRDLLLDHSSDRGTGKNYDQPRLQRRDGRSS
jgi:hypothetical protein